MRGKKIEKNKFFYVNKEILCAKVEKDTPQRKVSTGKFNFCLKRAHMRQKFS